MAEVFDCPACGAPIQYPGYGNTVQCAYCHHAVIVPAALRASPSQAPLRPAPAEFAGNPEPRCPCVLVLDRSGSMLGAPIAQLNAGLRDFKAALDQDELAALRVELAVVTFEPVQLQQDFVTAGRFVPPTLTAHGETPLGAALHLALDRVDARKQAYKRNGIPYYRPWVMLITDGAPTDDWHSAAARVRALEAEQKLLFFAVGVERADLGTLAQLTLRQPYQLKGLDFHEMFIWLSVSLTSVSHSQLTEQVPLPPAGWNAL